MSGLADAVVEALKEQRDAVALVDEQTRSMSVRVTSRDHNVRVKVDGFGTLIELWLGPGAHRLGPSSLAALIVETARVAEALVIERHNYVASELSARLGGLHERKVSDR